MIGERQTMVGKYGLLRSKNCGAVSDVKSECSQFDVVIAYNDPNEMGAIDPSVPRTP